MNVFGQTNLQVALSNSSYPVSAPIVTAPLLISDLLVTGSIASDGPIVTIDDNLVVVGDLSTNGTIKNAKIQDTTVTHTDLTASSIVVTGTLNNLESEAKKSAFNVDFGTAVGSVVDGGEYLTFTQQKGANNGLAELGPTGTVPTNQLPPFAPATTVSTVLDITGRDLLSPVVGDSVYVIDSSADTGKVQPQTYIFDGSFWVAVKSYDAYSLPNTNATFTGTLTYDSSTTGVDIYNALDAHVIKPNVVGSPPINGYLPTVPLTVSSTKAIASTNSVNAWTSFDNDNNSGWIPASNYNGGNYTGAEVTTLTNATTLSGDWLQFEFDAPLTVNGWKHFVATANCRIKDMSIVYSSDVSNPTNWYLIETSINNLMVVGTTYFRTFTNPPSNVQFIRIIIHSIIFTNQQWVFLPEVKFDCAYAGLLTTTIKKLDVQMDIHCDNLNTNSGLVDGVDVATIGPLATNALQKDGSNVMTGILNMNSNRIDNPLAIYANSVNFGIENSSATGKIYIQASSEGSTNTITIDPALSTMKVSNMDIDMSNNDVLNIGANGYNLNAHLVDSSVHFTKGSILHSNIQQIGLNSHDDIDTFITNTGTNLNNRLLKGGDTMSGILNMNQNRIDNPSAIYANSANFGIENSNGTGNIYLQASSEGTTNTLTLNPSTAKMTVTNMDLDMTTNNIVNCNTVKSDNLESNAIGGSLRIGYTDASSILIGKPTYNATMRGNLQVNGTSSLQGNTTATALTVTNTSPSIVFKDTRTGIENVQGGFVFTDATNALCSQVTQTGTSSGNMTIETFYPTSEITLQTAGGVNMAKLGPDQFSLSGVDLSIGNNGIEIGSSPDIVFTDIRNNALNIATVNKTITYPLPNGSTEFPYANIDSVPYAGTFASSTQLGNAFQTLYDPAVGSTWWFCGLNNYAAVGGAYIGSTVNNYVGGSVNGEYLQYTFVKSMSLENVRIGSYGAAFNAVSMTILGSNDGGTTLNFIQSFAGMTYPAGSFVYGDILNITSPQKYTKYNTYRFVYQSTNGGDPGYQRVSIMRTLFGFMTVEPLIDTVNINMGLTVKDVIQDTQRSYITKLQWTNTPYLFNPTTTNVYEPFHPIGTIVTDSILVPSDDATYTNNREIVIGAGGGGYYQINGACSFALAQNGDLVTILAISKNSGASYYCAQAIFNNKVGESLSVACSTIALLVAGDTLRLEMKCTNAVDNLNISSWCLAISRIQLNV